MNKAATRAAIAPAEDFPSATTSEINEAQRLAMVQQIALEQHDETRACALALQRLALRLAELGHNKAGGEALRAAVRLSRVRPGQHA